MRFLACLAPYLLTALLYQPFCTQLPACLCRPAPACQVPPLLRAGVAAASARCCCWCHVLLLRLLLLAGQLSVWGGTSKRQRSTSMSLLFCLRPQGAAEGRGWRSGSRGHVYRQVTHQKRWGSAAKSKARPLACGTCRWRAGRTAAAPAPRLGRGKEAGVGRGRA